MERTRKTDWLVAQGYRLSTIPPVVTWYVTDKGTGRERELQGRTDDYTLNLCERHDIRLVWPGTLERALRS